MSQKLPGIPQDEARQLLESNLEAIKQKVADKKQLTETERRLIRQYALGDEGNGPGAKTTPADESGPRWADNQVDLAVALGVDRKTIHRHLKKEDCPGKAANGKYDIHEWRYWLKMRGRKGGAKEGDDKSALECKKILQDMAVTDWEFQVKKAQYVSTRDVEQWFGKFAFGIKTTLLSWPGSVAPDVVKLFELSPDKVDTASAQVQAFLAKKVKDLLSGIADGPWQWKEHLTKAREANGGIPAPAQPESSG